MQTELLKIKGDWKEVVDDCRSTVGKESLGKEPSRDFKCRLLIAEHSPIRDIVVKWRWKDMPHWVTVHWVRHKWECFVRTQRSDRTGIPRDELPQDEPQTFVGEANAQHLIDTWRKRLCFTAAKETREYAEDLKEVLRYSEPEVSDVLVPNCVYRGGCSEMSPCGFYDKLCAYAMQKTDRSLGDLSIAKRYEIYNQYFYEEMKKGARWGKAE